MSIPAEAVPLATMVITQGFSVFNSFLPDLVEIRRQTPGDDPAFAADIRCAEAMASALVMGIGFLVSTLIQQPYPLYVSFAVVGGMVALYEYTYRSARFSHPLGA